MHSDFKKQHEIPYNSLVSSYICMQPQIVANQPNNLAICKQIFFRIVIHFYRNCLFSQSVNMKILHSMIKLKCLVGFGTDHKVPTN